MNFQICSTSLMALHKLKERKRNFIGIFCVILSDICTKGDLIIRAKTTVKSKSIGAAEITARPSAKPKPALKTAS